MGTNVVYNGVQLNNVVTRDWVQEIVYDPTDTDRTRTKYALAFEGVLSPLSSAMTNKDVWIGHVGKSGGLSPTYLMDQIKRRLEAPRAELLVTVADGLPGTRSGTLLHVMPAGTMELSAQTDIDNGPKPRSVSITRIAGSQAFRVKFAIEANLADCIGGGPIPYVINNRWSIGEALDRNFFVTRTIRGTLRVSNPTITPHTKRGLVVPGLENGFKRESLHFIVSANGLDAEYEVVDRQVYQAAPWPATTITGTFTHLSNDGITYLSECQIRLEGPMSAKRGDLIERAFQILDCKLMLTEERGGKVAENYYPEQVAIVESIGEPNIVDMRMRIRHIPYEESMGTWIGNLVKENLATPLDLPVLGDHEYNESVSSKPRVYGEDRSGEARLPATYLYLLSCYLQSPCEGSHGIVQGDTQPSPGEVEEVEEEDGGEPIDVFGLIAIGDIPTQSADSPYASTHRDYMYTHYEVSSRYLLNMGRLQLPLANPNRAATSASSFMVRVGQPQGRREIKIVAQRAGKWPAIPEPVDSYLDGANRGWLIKHWAEPSAPRPGPTGEGQVFELTAYYLYGLERPPLLTETASIGTMPCLNWTSDKTRFPPQEVYDGSAAV